MNHIDNVINKVKQISEDLKNDANVKLKETIDEKATEEYSRLYRESMLGKIANSETCSSLKITFNLLVGGYYSMIHVLFMILIGLIILFVTNKAYLVMTLIIISLDAAANIIFLDCPLTMLERQYFKTCMVENRLQGLQRCGLMYTNDKCYDTQLEVIINTWSLCAAKIMILIVFDWFHIVPRT